MNEGVRLRESSSGGVLVGFVVFGALWRVEWSMKIVLKWKCRGLWELIFGIVFWLLALLL